MADDQFFLQKKSVVNFSCLLLMPSIFLFLWIFGVPLITLIAAVVILCVFVCLVGSYIMTRFSGFSENAEN
jgi:hypothetical protein